jgi:hypothetical protein
MEDSNVRRMARVAEVDGLRLLFHGWEHDRFQQLYHNLHARVEEYTGMDTAEMNKSFRVKVVRHQGSTKGSLYALQLTGAAARAYHLLPWSLADHLTEMHVKVYAVQTAPDSYEWLIDAIYSGIPHTNVQLSFFGNKGTKRANPKGDGKGARVGSRKSDKHAVIYKRRGERPGIETRVSDRTLKRCLREVLDYSMTTSQPLDEPSLWRLLRAKVGVVGYAAMLDTLRGMGVIITDYVEGVSPSPDMDDSRVDWLDSSEENGYRIIE